MVNGRLSRGDTSRGAPRSGWRLVEEVAASDSVSSSAREDEPPKSIYEEVSHASSGEVLS